MLLKMFFTIICLFMFTSCGKKYLDNPEESDLIYQDIQFQLDTLNNHLNLREVELTELVTQLPSEKARSIEKEELKERIKVYGNEVVRYQQYKKYLEIKLKKRKSLARLIYHEKFKDNEPWPDQKEFKKYEVLKIANKSPIKIINVSDSSRSSTAQRNISKILNLFTKKK